MKKVALLLMLLIPVLGVNAQKSDKKSRKEIRAEKEALLKEQTQKLIENKNFEFIPDHAIPTRGRSVSISNFSVKVKGDTIVSYLPYYGRAYSVDYGSNSSPFDFTLVSEESNFSSNDKYNELKYMVKKGSDSLTYRFKIFEYGSSSLDVNSTNRQPISFRGQVEEIKNE